MGMGKETLDAMPLAEHIYYTLRSSSPRIAMPASAIAISAALQDCGGDVKEVVILYINLLRSILPSQHWPTYDEMEASWKSGPGAITAKGDDHVS